MQWTPHEYQKKAANFLFNREGGSLWMEMGLGKTVVAATVISELQKRDRAGRALIVAPLRVANSVWPAEFDKWDHLSHLRYQVLSGSPAERKAQLQRTDVDVDIINYEKLLWLAALLRNQGNADLPWDILILDEASKMKAPGTRRFRALRWLAPMVKYRYGLTGSPAANGLMDVWGPLYLTGAQAQIGRTFTAFKDRWFTIDSSGWKYRPRAGATEEIHEAVRPVALSMRANDYLNMPQRIETELRVELPRSARAAYTALDRDMMVELEESTVTAANAGVLVGKCLQAANGALYTAPGGQSWETLHDAKLEALDEVVEEAAGSPLIVAYSFRSDVARIQARFPQAVALDKKASTVDAWNRGEIPILLLHPASAGHGLNLQQGGHHICWFGLPWSFDLYAQTNARLWRQGQERPVFISRIMCDGTVDDTVAAALRTKRSVQDLLMERLRDMETT